MVVNFKVTKLLYGRYALLIENLNNTFTYVAALQFEQMLDF